MNKAHILCRFALIFRKTLDRKSVTKLTITPPSSSRLIQMKTVYIIEDEEILRNLLSTFFSTTYPDIEVLGMTGNGGEGVEQCLELAPDLVICDIQLPEINGLEILHLLKDQFPKIKILVFTGKTSHQSVKIAVHGKADGFINKISGLEELQNAIEAVSKGEQYFSPDVYDEVVRIRNEAPKHARSPF